MKVIIPAGGMGTRLRPHTLYTPKPLLFVGGDTIIGHIFSCLGDLNIDEFRIVVSPESSLPRLLSEAYNDRTLTFWIQDRPLGLGHAVLQALPDLGDEPILILLSDTIIPFDIQKAIAGTRTQEGFLVAREVDDPKRFGVIETNDEGLISKLVEKPDSPKSNLAIAGIYYLPSAKRLKSAIEELVKRDIKTRGEYQLTDALNFFVENGERLLPVIVDEWIDCGTSGALLQANKVLLSRNSRIVSIKGSLVKPPCWISDRVSIENSIIGPNVSIAENAVISNSIITNSIVNEGALVQRMILDETIIGIGAVMKGRDLLLESGPFSRLENL